MQLRLVDSSAQSWPKCLAAGGLLDVEYDKFSTPDRVCQAAIVGHSRSTRSIMRFTSCTILPNCTSVGLVYPSPARSVATMIPRSCSWVILSPSPSPLPIPMIQVHSQSALRTNLYTVPSHRPSDKAELSGYARDHSRRSVQD